MYEQSLKKKNPIKNIITYNITNVYNYIDDFSHLSMIIYDENMSEYVQHDKQLVKQFIFHKANTNTENVIIISEKLQDGFGFRLIEEIDKPLNPDGTLFVSHVNCTSKVYGLLQYRDRILKYDGQDLTRMTYRAAVNVFVQAKIGHVANLLIERECIPYPMKHYVTSKDSKCTVGDDSRRILLQHFGSNPDFLKDLMLDACRDLERMCDLIRTSPFSEYTDDELYIEMHYDFKNNVVLIHDNGMGLNMNDVMTNIKNVGESHISKIKMFKNINNSIISHRGHSLITTAKAAKKLIMRSTMLSSSSILWEMNGSEYMVAEMIDRQKRGTQVEVHLKQMEFSDETQFRLYIESIAPSLPFPVNILDTRAANVTSDHSKQEHKKKQKRIESIQKAFFYMCSIYQQKESILEETLELQTTYECDASSRPSDLLALQTEMMLDKSKFFRHNSTTNRKVLKEFPESGNISSIVTGIIRDQNTVALQRLLMSLSDQCNSEKEMSFERLQRDFHEAIEGVNRYNPENVSDLAACVQAMVAENKYDKDIVFTILKLYQLNLEKYDEAVVRQVLLKTLMVLPSSDFALAKCLIDTNRLGSQELRRIFDLGAVLESCNFAVFWKLMKGTYKPSTNTTEPFKVPSEIPKMVKHSVGFEDSIKHYACRVISVTFQNIEKKLLSRLLGGASDNEVTVLAKKFGWEAKKNKCYIIERSDVQVDYYYTTHLLDNIEPEFAGQFLAADSSITTPLL
ncbi:hypothetical protein CRE_30992 [Caenorhabditis remanei]|uniref:Eukaryotic translation initiation factor 3 subunit K n=1 Tax=Caenorhabditis remanei TaxID=31234 RepID=E3LTZ0_CAERE|nr:hypothetical protein CRE_30992 [Caenorhabditis remanei]